MPLPAVLTQLTRAKEEMALVIDEYGGFAGVLTIEDMAEELVGEIADEHDPDFDDAGIARSDDGWLIGGDVHLDEVARTLGHHMPQGDYETLAGLVIAEFGGLPAVGDGVEIPLDPDPAELAMGSTPQTRVLRAEVRAVERHVPDSVFVVVSADHDSGSEATP
jgi:CBS domain containing-hemolysin-like protein